MTAIEHIDTIRRLEAIKPGQRVRYYSGSSAEAHAGNPIVEAVFARARMLWEQGRLELKTERRTIAYPAPAIDVTDYIAIGK